MARGDNLRKQNGQILIESVFVAALVAALLLLFSHLIEVQRESYAKRSFSRTPPTKKQEKNFENPK